MNANASPYFPFSPANNELPGNKKAKPNKQALPNNKHRVPLLFKTE